MSIAITRGFCSLLAVLLLPVAAVAQSTFDTGGFTFRNDVETPASTGSGNQDFVFRGDMEQQQAVQESGSGPKSNAMGNYRFRAPRKQRTLSPTYNPGTRATRLIRRTRLISRHRWLRCPIQANLHTWYLDTRAAT
ncbi:hypothetical protein [Solemya velum gill symbiont]|uniref:hypothetical protein n=1 Tax=Solemya velum gill symbiont TaxID=2340 RepID=UPI000998B256|nr:hypothetical protein [Solemya velum gill symbiont]